MNTKAVEDARGAMALLLVWRNLGNSDEAVRNAWSDRELLHGLRHIIPGLLQTLAAHSAELGCDCGSDEWLNRKARDLAGKTEES